VFGRPAPGHEAGVGPADSDHPGLALGACQPRAGRVPSPGALLDPLSGCG